MKNGVFIFIFSTCIFCNVHAQTSSNSSGGEARGVGGSASFSIGQVTNAYQKSNSSSVNQGVQQPYQIKSLETNELYKNISISVAPNPTNEYLNLKVENPFNYNLNWKLISEDGELISGDKIWVASTPITMEFLSPGVYVIVVQMSNIVVKSIKIIKN